MTSWRLIENRIDTGTEKHKYSGRTKGVTIKGILINPIEQKFIDSFR